jgi:hypothetical protein
MPLCMQNTPAICANEVIGSSAGLVPINALPVRRSGTGSCFSPRQRRPLPMAKSKRKRVPKAVLKLPDLEQSKSAVSNSLTSSSSKCSYDHAIREFIDWYCSEPRLAFNRTVVTRYRIALEQHPYAPSTINLRLAAIRRLAYEASDCGLLSPDSCGRHSACEGRQAAGSACRELADGVGKNSGTPRIGRILSWVTHIQTHAFWIGPPSTSAQNWRVAGLTTRAHRVYGIS